MTERERLQAASDADVLAAIAAGSEAALEVLYRRLEGRLFRFLVGVVGGDAARAEDAMAETFVEVWRQAGTFRGASAVTTWVFGIARHKALSLVRRRRAVEPEAALARLPAADPDPLATVAAAEAAARVRAALERLSPEHREVLELALYQEFPYEAIAEIVGCPVNTVKTRAYHARRRLERHLADLGEAGP
jgi:RNA polymerase sigma-70 factor (ECF subfamily)